MATSAQGREVAENQAEHSFYRVSLGWGGDFQGDLVLGQAQGLVGFFFLVGRDLPLFYLEGLKQPLLSF